MDIPPETLTEIIASMNSIFNTSKASANGSIPVGASVATGLITGLGGWLLLLLMPQLPKELFARGAAEIAGLLTGAPVCRVIEGWMLSGGARPAVVSVACSATDYFLILAILISWQLARNGQSPVRTIPIGLCAALPLAICVNALRVVAVVQAHRWLIPKFPEAYGHFLHLLTGVAIFLPALIALNLLFEIYGRPRTLVCSR
jgi:exosortase/archaeosortase family protein